MVDAEYRSLLDAALIDPDPEQARAIAAFTRLQRDLEGYAPPAPPRRGLFGLRSAPAAEPPKGIYLHGGVGRGKSMLMDLFFRASPIGSKRRAHFHDFMLDVHARLHDRRKSHPREGDPLVPLAEALAAEAWLLCFDEFHVSDIADAMILGRLFDNLFARGVVVVATSNWAPDDLYAGGLQRQLFVPFIERLKRQVVVLPLAGERDYRLDRLRDRQVYFHPLGPAADTALGEVFADLTDGDPGSEGSLKVGGRTLVVPRQAKGVAWFHFDALCARALGAADYLALAARYHTLILDNVPMLTPDKRNEARRFVTLVDALYERGMHLVCAAEAPPELLYPTGDGAFEFQRTVSRLTEMQSKDYVERARERAAHPGPFAPFALTSDL